MVQCLRHFGEFAAAFPYDEQVCYSKAATNYGDFATTFLYDESVCYSKAAANSDSSENAKLHSTGYGW